ncbi:hypothetical protein Pr1d_44270 [Bythopirellula goksoeyrii]|uniref:Uncharacterized protein n=1 Tax=Bythopirellula goksoeyrii TaxID=1400387 RepID=A0A5B9QDE4_9BACT|nr:hypothetical protein Pr1d_44270 [Bythopirellula goksoeyrii]
MTLYDIYYAIGGSGITTRHAGKSFAPPARKFCVCLHFIQQGDLGATVDALFGQSVQ